jgi:CRP-like cAMP-binding protein
MIDETVGKGSTPVQFPRRPARGAADLHALNATSAPVRADARRQEGRKLLDLLHEAGAATVERRYARAEVIFVEGNPGNALYVLTEGVVKLSRGYAGGKEAT